MSQQLQRTGGSFRSIADPNSFEDLSLCVFERTLLAEFVGTFWYVFNGVLSSVPNIRLKRAPTTHQISICFGVSFLAATEVMGHISGAHFNPAVSIAKLLVGELKASHCLCYILVQCCGAIAASLVVSALVPGSSAVADIGVSLNKENLGTLQHFLVELLLTLILILVTLAATDHSNRNMHRIAPLLLGFAVFMLTYLSYDIDGASMNPARSLGPALVNWQWRNHWIYWLGPISGSVLAGNIYRKVNVRRVRRVRVSVP